MRAANATLRQRPGTEDARLATLREQWRGDLLDALPQPIGAMRAELTSSADLAPAMVVACVSRALGGAPIELVRRAALASELLRLAHVAFARVPGVELERHSHLATAVTVLAGDACLTRAMEISIPAGAAVSRAISVTSRQMCDGQLRQTRDLFNPDRTVADYEQTIEARAAPLFALSAWLGATLAGAPSAVVKALQRYGHELGVAYQIADDLGDLLGEDPTKNAGSDLREGVYTLPVIYAIQAEPRLRELLTPTLTTADIERIVQTATHTGALTRTRRHCHHHARAAAHTLHQIPTPQPLLEGLTQSILGP